LECSHSFSELALSKGVNILSLKDLCFTRIGPTHDVDAMLCLSSGSIKSDVLQPIHALRDSAK